MAGTLVYTQAGLVVLFLWLLFGDFAWMARERAVTPLTQVLLKSYHVSDTVIGFLLGSIPSALSMILLPVVSYRSDRCRSPLGRRIPFLLATVPAVSLSLLTLAFVPSLSRMAHEMLGPHSPGLKICFLMIFSVVWIVFEVSAIVGNGLFVALINDVVPQQIIGRFFGLFRIVGLAVGLSFNFFLMGKAETHYMVMFIVLGILYGVGFGLMCLRVKEGDYPPPATQHYEGILVSVRRYFRECFAHPFYRMIFLTFALSNVVFIPVNAFSLFFARSVGMSLDAYGKALAIGMLCTMLLSYPLGSLADRLHPLRIGIASLVLYLLLSVAGAIWASTEWAFGITFVAHVVVSGIFLTGVSSLGQRLFPQSVFGQFFSAASMVTSIFIFVLTPVVGIILDISGSVYRLTFLMGGILAALTIVAFVAVLRYYNSLGGDRSYSAP